MKLSLRVLIVLAVIAAAALATGCDPVPAPPGAPTNVRIVGPLDGCAYGVLFDAPAKATGITGYIVTFFSVSGGSSYSKSVASPATTTPVQFWYYHGEQGWVGVKSYKTTTVNGAQKTLYSSEVKISFTASCSPTPTNIAIANANGPCAAKVTWSIPSTSSAIQAYDVSVFRAVGGVATGSPVAQDGWGRSSSASLFYDGRATDDLGYFSLPGSGSYIATVKATAFVGQYNGVPAASATTSSSPINFACAPAAGDVHLGFTWSRGLAVSVNPANYGKVELDVYTANHLVAGGASQSVRPSGIAIANLLQSGTTYDVDVWDTTYFPLASKTLIGRLSGVTVQP